MTKSNRALTIFGGFSVGIAIGFLYERINDRSETVPKPSPLRSSTGSILSIPQATDSSLPRDWYDLQSKDAVSLTEEQFTQLIGLQDRNGNTVSWHGKTVTVNLASLGISNEYDAKVEDVLTSVRNAFRKADIERLQHTETATSVKISVPAYPTVGEQLIKEMASALTDIVGDKAKLLIPVALRTLSTPTSNFGKQSKEFVITSRDDGRVHVEVFLGGVPNGSLLAHGEMPLKWQHLASFAFPELVE